MAAAGVADECCGSHACICMEGLRSCSAVGCRPAQIPSSQRAPLPPAACIHPLPRAET